MHWGTWQYWGKQKPYTLANFMIEDILNNLHIKKTYSYLGWITSHGVALSFSFIFVSMTVIVPSKAARLYK